MLAECCREQGGLDAVWFLPAAVPPHKRDRELTPVPKRIEMLQLAIAGHQAFSVCTYETDRGGINYTVDTLTHFREEDPSARNVFPHGRRHASGSAALAAAGKNLRVGAAHVVHRAGMAALDFECLADITTPRRIEEIRRRQVEMPEIGISSSDIRRRVAEGKTIRYLSPAQWKNT